MRILLVNPPAQNTISSEISDVVREGGKLPPLGLLYLVAALKRAGHEVRFFDAGNSGAGVREVLLHVQDFAAEVVGVTATTHQLVDAVHTLAAVRRQHPGVLRLLGGPHANAFPEASARLDDVDVAFFDEADVSLPALLDGWGGKPPAIAPPGVAFVRDGLLLRGDQLCKPEDLDELARPDRTVLDQSLYGDVTVGEGPLATASTSRGCPYACTFCSTPGPPVRLRDPVAVADELAELVGQGFGEVYFVDDTFNIKPERAAALCEQIIRRKLPLTWTCRVRLDRLTPELVKLLEPAGCTRVQLGVEAATQEALDLLGKNITPDDARNAVRMLRKAGVPSAAYFMIGLPTDRTLADIRRTVDFAIELDPDYAVFNVLVPYPNTKLFDLAVEKGIVDPQVWQTFAERPDPSFRPPVWTEFHTPQTLYDQLRRAYRRFYLRPRTIWRQAKRLTPSNVWAIAKRAGDIVRG